MAPESAGSPSPFGEFDAKLARARKKGEPQQGRGPGRSGSEDRPLGHGVQAGIEVIAGVAVGLAVGWALDHWTGLRPLFLIVFFVLGAAAGLLNAYRHLRRVGMLLDGETRK
ncbi:ATP synthase protein I [bacterium HR40]|nr:ATP synthase protein I [bacterium HR40]